MKHDFKFEDGRKGQSDEVIILDARSGKSILVRHRIEVQFRSPSPQDERSSLGQEDPGS